MSSRGKFYPLIRSNPAGRKRGESDLEKRKSLKDPSSESEYADDESESTSRFSSRSTSSTTHTLLNKSSPRRIGSSFLYRARRSGLRWSCWLLAGGLIIFIFTLAHLSWTSGQRLRLDAGALHSSPTPAWEAFSFLRRYYGGVKTVISREDNNPEYPSAPDQKPLNNTGEMPSQGKSYMHGFDPYPKYNSSEYLAKYLSKTDCFLDKDNTIRVPSLQSYKGVPRGFPNAVMGSNDVLGMDDNACFDRFGRLGPYGLGYGLKQGGSGAALGGDKDGVEEVWRQNIAVDYREVRWAEAQKRCAEANQNRFQRSGSEDRPTQTPARTEPRLKGLQQKLPKTAVVIRTWTGYKYTTEDILYLRSLIAELSLNSGGEYMVRFLIHVKDDNAPIWSDANTHDRILRDSLPSEFEGLGILWSERQMGLLYGGLEESFHSGLPVHGVYRSSYMPLQHFAYIHPEYDFVWNWEMDTRYTGHWYHLLDRASNWAKLQPRKGLWERNSRFYVPSEHGSWQDFGHMVRVQTQHGTNSPNNIWSDLSLGGTGEKPASRTKKVGEKPIWGPEPPIDDGDIAMDTDPGPPHSYEADQFEWGVNEEADLITFNPLFDPAATTWLLAEDVTGYNTSRSLPPRRSAIIASSRLSRRLLMTMHREVSLKRHTMFTEMWPASCALHHGLKAVYAPHSEYVDRQWPTAYLEATFNAGRNGATGGARTSVFGELEHNFRGMTWYYNAGFPEVLWHRWLGMRFNNDGGEEFEVNGVGKEGGGEGRMCLPAMLLHPIKRVDLAIEGSKD